MASSNLSFSAQIDAWAAKAEVRQIAIARQSAQVLNDKIIDNLSGGMVNVQTGFLRASERASLSEMPKINPAAHPRDGASYQPADITVTIANLQMGQTLYCGFTAAYAAHVHDGTSRMAPRPYVALPAAGWSGIVEQVTAELKARAGAGQ